MKKFDIKIPQQTWGQIRSKNPADSEFIQDDDFTKGTKNIDTTVKGVITKRPGGIPYNPILLASPVKDQYEGIFEDGVRHLLGIQSGEIKFSSGDQVFNTVVNGTGFVPTANFEFATINNKLYGDNGVNAPQVYDRTTSYGGVAYSAPQLKVMGAQTPTVPPIFVSQTGAGIIPTGSFRYKYTFVYYGNEESNGSPEIAAPVTVGGSGSDVTLTIAAGGYGVTARNIYRALDGTEDFLLVGVITDNTTTAFVDDAPAGTFTIPVEHNVPPIFNFNTLYQDAQWLSGIQGQPFTLRYSNKGLPDIVPLKNFVICNQEDPIVATIVFRGRLIVFNRSSMGQILGNNFFNYEYEDIQGSVGCVDARSIQVRTIRGIPTLIWLSDKGLYTYNGNSIDYVSEPIEDLVNFNVQQAQFNKAKDVTSNNAELNSLIRSDGILVVGDQLSTITPRKQYSSQVDWDGGLIIEDMATSQGKDTIKSLIPETLEIDAVGVQNQGTIQVGSTIKLPTLPNFIGETEGSDLISVSESGSAKKVAWKFSPVRDGQLVQFSGAFVFSAGGGFPGVEFPVSIKIFLDAADSPGAELATATTFTFIVGGILEPISFNKLFPGVNLFAGVNYWIGLDFSLTPGTVIIAMKDKFTSGDKRKVFENGSWENSINGPFTLSGPTVLQYTFEPTITPNSGTWISEELDSQSIYVTKQVTYNHNITLNNTVSGAPVANDVRIEGSNNELAPRLWTLVKDFDNISTGNHVFTPSTEFRFWRVVVGLSTPDNTDGGAGTEGTPVYSGGTLTFNTVGTWESDPIFTSDDVTSFDSLISDSTLPGQTVLEIATAPATGGPFTAFTLIGSATPDKFAKVRLTLTTSGSNAPIVSQVTFDWSISSTAEIDISGPINAGTDIAGWDIFLAEFALNGGTALFEMRSATTAPGLSSEGYVTVNPPDFPTGVPVNQFAQWRVTLTASATSVPTVSSVTTQWFIGSTDSIRVGSLFFNRVYYLVAAKFGSTTNNIFIVFDGENKFRLYEDINVNTLGRFFNDFYLGSADDGRIVKFLEGLLDDNTTNIEVDIRTRAFDLGRRSPKHSDRIKLLKQVEVRVKNTGTTIQGFYSVDEGLTFNTLAADDGTPSFTTSTDGKLVTIRFRVKYDGSTPLPGKTVMVRLVTNDAFELEIHNIRLKGFIREAEVVNIAQ